MNNLVENPANKLEQIQRARKLANSKYYLANKQKRQNNPAPKEECKLCLSMYTKGNYKRHAATKRHQKAIPIEQIEKME